jgi:hypothetical protein
MHNLTIFSATEHKQFMDQVARELDAVEQHERAFRVEDRRERLEELVAAVKETARAAVIPSAVLTTCPVVMVSQLRHRAAPHRISRTPAYGGDPRRPLLSPIGSVGRGREGHALPDARSESVPAPTIWRVP